jgi:hypothetical protein
MLTRHPRLFLTISAFLLALLPDAANAQFYDDASLRLQIEILCCENCLTLWSVEVGARDTDEDVAHCASCQVARERGERVRHFREAGFTAASQAFASA